MKSRPTQSGLTVLELMVAVAVLAITVTIGVPGFQAVMQNNRAVSQANQLVGALNVARSEAVKRGVVVRVCVDDDLSTIACNGANWHDGWRVWADTDADGNVDNGETIQTAQALGGSATLTSVDTVSVLQYQPSGFLGTVLASGTFQLRLPNCTGTNNRDITLSATGRPNIKRVTCP